MSKTNQRDKSGWFYLVIKFILRRKTLVGILFFLCVFLIKELAALSAGDTILSVCDSLLTKHQNGILFYLISFTKAFFSSGSSKVLFITILMILNISFLKYLSLLTDKLGKIHLYLFFFLLVSTSIWIFLVLFKTGPNQIDNKYILIEPQINNSQEIEPHLKSKYQGYYNNLNEQSNNRFYEKITELYNSKDFDLLKHQISSTFKVEIEDLSEDDILGYVVAAFFGQKKYKEAAETVLIRNENRKVWDHSLKLDFSKCIRFYSLQNGFSYGCNLVDTLKLKYKENIVSKLWTSIPFEIMANIESGVHNYSGPNIDKITSNNLKTILQDSTSHRYCDYAYYLLKDYDKALNCSTNSRITDVVLYARSKLFCDSLEMELQKSQSNKKDSDTYWYSSSIDYNLVSEVPINSKSFDSSLNDLLLIRDNFKKAHHYEDAILLSTWMYFQKHQYKNALINLNHIDLSKSRNKSLILNTKNKIYTLDATIDIIEDFEVTYNSMQKKPVYNSNYLDNLLDNVGKEESENLVLSGKISSSYLFDLLDYKYKTGSIEEFTQYYELVNQSKLSTKDRKYFQRVFGEQYIFLKKDVSKLKFNEFIATVDSIQGFSSYLYRKSLKRGLDIFQSEEYKEIILYKLLREDVNQSPSNCSKYLTELIKIKPDSDLLDDFYAEVIFANYIHIGDEEKGEFYLNEMINRFKDKQNNALDNALYWVTMWYMDDGYFSWRPNPKSRKKALHYKDIFFEMYPNSLQEFNEEDVESAFKYLYW